MTETETMSYQHIASEENETSSSQRNVGQAKRTLSNFILMSILFSTNHASVVSCIGLATSQLGSAGAWQNGLLYFAYTGSAILGATYVVKRLGSRDALILGMLLYFIYTLCFSFAVSLQGHPFFSNAAVGLGGFLGGVGGGFLWTAQGSYFTKTAEEYSLLLQQSQSISTSRLAAVFAFIYLIAEVGLRSLSTILLQFTSLAWSAIFVIYTILTLVSTILMFFLYRYPVEAIEGTASGWAKVTAALQLLINDPKMKYMIGLNASFGFASAFLNAYVNGEVVSEVLNDTEFKYVGLLTAWLSTVAAVMSLVFGKLAEMYGKGPILILGSVCFFLVAFPFLVAPNLDSWGWFMLTLIYTLHGTGRATFEGTLKATFADFFSYEKEGAFANIILQNGLSSAIGYFMTITLTCSEPSSYCVRFHKDNNLHNILVFEIVIVFSSLFAVAGYLVAARLNRSGHVDVGGQESELIANEEATEA